MTVLAWTLAAALAGIEVNSASQADLEAVRGIGVATSTLILEERSRAPFKDWADFAARVPGVGGKNAARLSAAGVTVNGVPLKPAPRPPAPLPPT